MLYDILANFPYREEAITVGLMVRLKPGTMITFCFEVPRHQKYYSFKFIYICVCVCVCVSVNPITFEKTSYFD